MYISAYLFMIHLMSANSWLDKSEQRKIKRQATFLSVYNLIGKILENHTVLHKVFCNALSDHFI
jgi:hypothetical protein